MSPMQRFKSPIRGRSHDDRFKSPIRRRSKERIGNNNDMVQMIEDFDTRGISEIEMEAFKRKKSSASRFMSPSRFRSPIRRTREKSKAHSTKEVSQSEAESNGFRSPIRRTRGKRKTHSSKEVALSVAESNGPADATSKGSSSKMNNDSESRGSGMERGLDPDGIVASESVANSVKSKASSTTKSITSVKSNKK